MNSSIQTTDKAIGSLSSSVTQLGDSIKDKLTPLAQSFSHINSITYGRPIYNLPPPMEHYFQQATFNKVPTDHINKMNFYVVLGLLHNYWNITGIIEKLYIVNSCNKSYKKGKFCWSGYWNICISKWD